VNEPEPAPTARRLRWVVPVLGIAQIISWGSLYYPIAVLAAAMGRDLDIGEIAIFGSFTVGLFVSGIVAPVAGRLVDTRGGRLTLSCGSALGALALLVLALLVTTMSRRREQKRRQGRVEAKARDAEAGRRFERAESLEEEARRFQEEADRRQAEANRHAEAAQEERSVAEEHAERARKVDPDR